MTPSHVLISEVEGHRYWRQDFKYRTPAFEVFKVVAYDPDRGDYYFRSVRENSIIKKSINQLNVAGFAPFIYSNEPKGTQNANQGV